MNITIRKAHANDVKALHALMMKGSEQGLLLPRSLYQIQICLRDFFVADRGGDDPVVGCSALAMMGDTMAEVRSLFVSEEMRGQGLGSKLVQACLEEAATFGMTEVFTLTYQTALFGRMGFKELPKESLPHKIWTVCINCPKFPNCDEVAMIRPV